MKAITFFFLYVQSVCCLGQQTISLNLKAKEWDIQRKNFYAHKYLPKKFISMTDSAYILRNQDTVSRYAIYSITIQNRTALNRGCYLNILIGPNNHQQLILVIDNNKNENFGDDSVYIVDMRQPVSSEYDFYNRLPVIAIDSLHIYNKQNKIEYKGIKLKLGVSASNGEKFEYFEQLKTASSFFLDVYITEYYSATLQRGNETYEFGVASNPLIQGFSEYPGTNNGGSILIQYKKLVEKDTVIRFLPLHRIKNKNPDPRNAFTIDGDIFIIDKLTIDNKRLTLSKSSHQDARELKLIVKKNHEGLSGLLSDSVYTLLDFSGSWCKPCQVILPKLNILYKKYNSMVKFITVAVENNLETAQQYHNKTGNEWQMVYENLNCRDEQCLKNKLNVSGYPTLILIDTNKRIVFQNAGSEAIDELEQLFQKLFAYKKS
ncbi:MAG TPA: TlpA disulfide reductase family protein [Chitinophagaceae bacterium]|nr:TlpA disulfide reductase family protein [Chitinophagaceae bacterium]